MDEATSNNLELNRDKRAIQTIMALRIGMHFLLAFR